jgi:ribosomal-protein-alanine acetyltransferase
MLVKKGLGNKGSLDLETKASDGTKEVTIGPVTPRDLQNLVNLERECFATEAYTERQMRDLLESPNAIAFLAKVDDDIVGFAISLVEDFEGAKTGHIVTIDVAVKHRRKGIGLTLLKAAEDALLQREVQIVYLEVRADNNPALQLYNKRGYVKTEVLEDYYSAGVRAVRMMKQLKS